MAIRDKETYLERDLALYEAYKAARKRIYDSYDSDSKEAKNIHQMAIIEAINTRQGRFWITQDRTYRILCSLINNRSTKTWKTRTKMYQELLAAYLRLRQKRMFKDMPLLFVASFVTYEPASGFFMSMSRAGRVISKHIKMQKQNKHA